MAADLVFRRAAFSRLHGFVDAGRIEVIAAKLKGRVGGRRIIADWVIRSARAICRHAAAAVTCTLRSISYSDERESKALAVSVATNEKKNW